MHFGLELVGILIIFAMGIRAIVCLVLRIYTQFSFLFIKFKSLWPASVKSVIDHDTKELCMVCFHKAQRPPKPVVELLAGHTMAFIASLQNPS
jgi:hypothetical protein